MKVRTGNKISFLNVFAMFLSAFVANFQYNYMRLDLYFIEKNTYNIDHNTILV